MLFSDEEMEVLKRLHNLHKKTLTVGGRAGIHILKVHLTPSRGVATKHKGHTVARTVHLLLGNANALRI